MIRPTKGLKAYQGYYEDADAKRTRLEPLGKLIDAYHEREHTLPSHCPIT
jgi:hypothetical protein